MKGQGGIFVKLPGGRSGFLRQISGLAPGQRLLVQVSGPAEPGKAAARHRRACCSRAAMPSSPPTRPA